MHGNFHWLLHHRLLHRHSHGLLRNVHRIRLLHHLGLHHNYRLLLHLRLRLLILISKVLNAFYECIILSLKRCVHCFLIFITFGLLILIKWMNLRRRSFSVWVIIVLLSLVSERANYWSEENYPNRTNSQIDTLIKGVVRTIFSYSFAWKNANPNDDDEH